MRSEKGLGASLVKADELVGMPHEGYTEPQNPRKDNKSSGESGGVSAKFRKPLRCDHRGDPRHNEKPHPDEREGKPKAKTENEEEPLSGLAYREGKEHHTYRTWTRHEPSRCTEGDDLQRRRALAAVDVFREIA